MHDGITSMIGSFPTPRKKKPKNKNKKTKKKKKTNEWPT
ncbi:unnamed protein product [Spirodela intermedia]|uniref:Uncharacterized protein n=1 Tax=Spirodela intermedia TaxID=51605 RepID=A0A7I8K0T2_SPIIN|nr:unnamed protein product [Spirodela intermedia]